MLNFNFSPQHHINGKGEKFKLGTCQGGKFSEAAQSCDAVDFRRRSKEISVGEADSRHPVGEFRRHWAKCQDCTVLLRGYNMSMLVQQQKKLVIFARFAHY